MSGLLRIPVFTVWLEFVFLCMLAVFLNVTTLCCSMQSPQHRLGMITTPSSGTLPNVYVDSRRLPSPRPSSKHSNFSRQSDTSRHNGTSQESSSRTSSSEVTVNQLNHIPHVHVGTRPTTYNHGK